jgi:hypothetical protein
LRRGSGERISADGPPIGSLGNNEERALSQAQIRSAALSNSSASGEDWLVPDLQNSERSRGKLGSCSVNMKWLL